MKAWWVSLRAKLIASYVGALVLALAVFGAIAVIVIDRDLRASLDTRLTTVARAALSADSLQTALGAKPAGPAPEDLTRALNCCA